MVAASKAAMPTITDQSATLQLNNATKQMTNALTELRSSLLKVCTIYKLKTFNQLICLCVCSCQISIFLNASSVALP